MANIFCTKKLERLVGKAYIQPEPKNDILGSWNANIFPVQGRKCLILMNDQTYYSLLFLDILKKDLLKFHLIFVERLIEQLSFDRVDFPVDCTPLIMDDLTPRFLSTNNNRKVLGTMNEFIYEAEYHINYSYDGKLEHVNLPQLNHVLNSNLVGALMPKKHEYGRPIEVMRNKLAEVCR